MSPVCDWLSAAFLEKSIPFLEAISAADKLSRTNIAIDVGFGEHSTGIYFGAAEVF